MAVRDAARRKLTYQDYVLIPEDGQRHEIVDGDHCVFPAPLTRHQRISMRLSSRLGSFAESSGFGEVFAAPTDVLLSRHDILQPDLFFVAKERAAIVTEKNVQGAPDLVVEILSDGTRRIDEGVKLARYELFGVREGWIFDPSTDRVRVYRAQGGRLQKVAELSAEARDVLTTPLLPGLEIPLLELFR
ncbi:MAG TPA: Uma2 family endonuclease [Thermoanaerobaculia bacterium]|jgi:Uma2 family endonuclease|nr:Uma2 family endonuclease [Thermoanaerobaculia bacterium]